MDSIYNILNGYRYLIGLLAKKIASNIRLALPLSKSVKLLKRHPHYCQIVSPSDLDLRKKNAIFL